MLDLKAQSELADATAGLMRSCALAAAKTMTASACQGLSLWSDLVRASAIPRARGWWSMAPPAGPLRLAPWLSPSPWTSVVQINPWSPAMNPWSAIWPWLPARFDGRAWAPYARTWAGPSLTAWMPLAGWAAWNRAPLPIWSGRLEDVQAPPSATSSQGLMRPAPDGDFASYRSAGGHAAAQVIVAAPAAVARLEGPKVRTLLSPIDTLLGVWRAALGV